MDWTRRNVLATGAGATMALGSARGIYNVFLGYGTVFGTNLLDQDLDPIVTEDLSPSNGPVTEVDGYQIEYHTRSVRVREGDRIRERFDLDTVDSSDPATTAEELGLSGNPLAELIADLRAIEAESVRFEYHSYPGFFQRLENARTRPVTVQALRGSRRAKPRIVESFADADPADPEAVARGLVEGFREHTSYDYRRYTAGAIEDNVLFGRGDLRSRYESPSSFEAMMAGEDSGLFCTELTRRSVDALQAVPGPEQTVPVVAGFVRNERHKHTYTIVASALREGTDELVVPVTFLDYTDTTQYDDLRLERILGEGLDAYDDRHRATYIGWYE